MLSGPELASVAVAAGALLYALITRVYGASRKDAALYPFIAAVVCFVIAASAGSWVSGVCFLGSLLVGFLIYQEDQI